MAYQSDEARIAELERQLAALKQENQELQAVRPQRQPRGWRSAVSGTLLALGMLVAVPAGVLLWLDRTVINTDNYIKSVGPVIEQPAVQKAIQKKASEAVFSRVNVEQEVKNLLPEQAAALAGPIATQVENYTTTSIGTIVASPQFATVWVEANTKAHEAFLKLADNPSPDASVNVSDLYTHISARLQDTPLAGLTGRELPAQVGNIEVANIPALEQVPRYVDQLAAWRWGLLAVMAALVLLAVGVASNRRRTLVWLGLGLVLSGLVTLVVIRVARAMTLDPLTDPVYREAAVSMWQTVLYPFLGQLAVTAVLGLAIAITGWLAGPGRVATSVRTTVQRWLAGAHAAIMPSASGWGWVKSMRRHHRQYLWGLVVLTVLTLFALTPLTVPMLLGVVILSVIVLVLLELVVAPDGGANALSSKHPSASQSTLPPEKPTR